MVAAASQVENEPPRSSAFVIRLDVAASPDANPVSGYFSAGRMF